MTSKLSIAMGSIEVQGINQVNILERLSHLKRELEALGCEVSISVQGVAIDEIEVESIPEVKIEMEGE